MLYGLARLHSVVATLKECKGSSTRASETTTSHRVRCNSPKQVSQWGNFSQITPCLPSALVGCTRLSFLHADPTRVGRQHAEQARPLRGASGPTAPPPTPRRPVGPVAGSPQSRWVRARPVRPMASKHVLYTPRTALKLSQRTRTHSRCA